MENKKRKSTGLLLSILGVISLVLITAGVTYAFFSYAKQGETTNTISTGSITFVYDETGNALTISDALPKSDSTGMTENASSAFEFEVTSSTPSTAYINYIVTVKKGANSTLPENQVKMYLTTTSDNTDTSVRGFTPGVQTGTTAGQIKTFDTLPLASNQAFSSIFAGTNTAPAGERVIYAGQVPASGTAGQASSYSRTFRLNMWLVGSNGGTCSGYSGVAEAPTTEDACTEAEGTWTPSTTGMADYSAYEFVKKSSVSGNDPIAVVDSGTGLVKGTDILTSVNYYNGLQAQVNPLSASDYERIAYVNQASGKVLTRSQAVALGYATNTNGVFAYTTGNTQSVTISGVEYTASEQYYPLNGGTFTVTVNVYAEGATTYSVQ